MGTLKTCDKCKMAPDSVSRYSVRRYVKSIPGQRHVGTFQSAGSIDLCLPCWERICKPRTRTGDYTRSGSKA